MIFSFHNKLEIKTKNGNFEFYNTILKSTLEKLAKFEKYNEYISIGNGKPNSNFQDNFHLTNPLFTGKLSNYSFQSDLSKGSVFAKYEFIITKNDINQKFITEIGLSNNDENPKIFNYFSLITNGTPNGIDIENTEEVAFEITINLTINETEILLTSGNNLFIEYLLGNGLDKIYICKGSNHSSNNRINRQLGENLEMLPCEVISLLNGNTLSLDIYQKLTVGEIDEILFISNNKVFARKNLKEINQPSTENVEITSQENYVIKINEDIKCINSIINTSTQTSEDNYYVSKFANSFGDKITLPFNNLFNHQTSRFLSKDGHLIFFILNDKVYGYINKDFSITELNTSNISDDNISKIIAFDKYVFIFSKIFPYISTYIIEDNILIKQSNNFSAIENINKLENCLQFDITMCNNGNFILGLILEDKTALSIYFQYTSTDGFTVKNQIANDKEFHYLLAMYKNNFCDGQMIYLKEGTSSVECRIVTHSADETETDAYSSIAYYLTNNSTRIYCKNRAIISEKNTEPSVVIYYYPQIYEYSLPLISSERQDYISEDLNYIIQRYEDNSFSIYNLVGYNTPEEFTDKISDFVDVSKIEDFEFLKDTLLIFLNDNETPITAFNLNLNKTQIENLSSKNSNYLISLTKYNKVGTNNETVSFSLSIRINL